MLAVAEDSALSWVIATRAGIQEAQGEAPGAGRDTWLISAVSKISMAFADQSRRHLSSNGERHTGTPSLAGHGKLSALKCWKKSSSVGNKYKAQNQYAPMMLEWGVLKLSPESTNCRLNLNTKRAGDDFPSRTRKTGSPLKAFRAVV